MVCKMARDKWTWLQCFTQQHWKPFTCKGGQPKTNLSPLRYLFRTNYGQYCAADATKTAQLDLSLVVGTNYSSQSVLCLFTYPFAMILALYLSTDLGSFHHHHKHFTYLMVGVLCTFLKTNNQLCFWLALIRLPILIYLLFLTNCICPVGQLAYRWDTSWRRIQNSLM